MINKEDIRKIAEVKAAQSTNFIVDISIRSGNKITILMDDDAGVSINNCIEMSKYVESNLDRELEDFELNVMSAGLTEPLKVTRQYQKNIGKQIDVLTKENKKITGKLLSVTDEEIVIESKIKEKVEGKKTKQIVINNIKLAFNQIKQTKVVISF